MVAQLRDWLTQNFDRIADAIKTLGFPIVCACWAAWFMVQTINWERTEMLKALNDSTTHGHNSTEALENNTRALEMFVDRMEQKE